MNERIIIPDSEYQIKTGQIVEAEQMTPEEKFYKIVLPHGAGLNHDPGQFVEVSRFGVGEVPISIASSPTRRHGFDLCIRNVGKVTNALHKLGVGDEVGIRGPFGKGFPLQHLEGSDLLIVAGGLGIVPLRSLIHFIIDNRREFGQVDILLGCKTPKNMLFGNEIDLWGERLDINFACTVDRGDPDWKGNVGMITSLIPGVTLQPRQTYAIVVGPPVMYKFVIRELKNKGIADDHIILSLERHMKCGLGKCGHCQINKYYCCQDGPVFFYDQIMHLEEALA